MGRVGAALRLCRWVFSLLIDVLCQVCTQAATFQQGYMYALHFVKKYTGKDIAAPLLVQLVPAALSYGRRCYVFFPIMSSHRNDAFPYQVCIKDSW